VDGPVHQGQLQAVGGAQRVHHHERVVAAGQAEGGDQPVEEVGAEFVGGGEGPPADAAFAVDADSQLDFVVGEFPGGKAFAGMGAGGQGDAHAARIADQVPAELGQLW